MTFRVYLQKNAEQIDLEIESFFQEWSKDITQISPRLLPLINALADACRGGKRIRGALVVLGYEMSLTGSRNDILKIAGAYEIFQTAILAHDDVIDRSLLRRGKPSLYASFGDDHIGKSIAICLGDIGFFLAFKLIAESEFPEKEKNRALAIFSKTMLDTGLGELLDTELSMDPRVKPEDDNDGSVKDDNYDGVMLDIITVYKLKTAYYTITAPLLMGGILGGLSESSLDAIKIFGQNLGIAFQLQDDINDIFSDKKKLGKEVGGDIKEGKQTLLFIYAKEHADKRQREVIEKYYGNTTIGLKEIEIIKNILVETGALEYVRMEIKDYNQKARETISEVTQNERVREMLAEMTEYFVE